MAILDVMAQAGYGIFGLMLFLIGGVIFLAIIFVIYKIYKWNAQFTDTVLVLKKDNLGNIVGEWDRGGACFDVQSKHRLWFLKSGIGGLDPDKKPFISTKKGVFVIVFKQGLKALHYVTPIVNEKGDMELKVSDQEISWAINAYERSKKILFWDRLKEFLPYIAAFMFMVIACALLVFLINKLDLKAVVAQLESTARIIAEAKMSCTGSVIK